MFHTLALIVAVVGLVGIIGGTVALWLIDRRTARRQPGHQFGGRR